MGDQHKTERLQLAELHALGSWPVAVAALESVGPEWVLAFRRGVLAEIRQLTFLLEPETYEPALLDRLDRFVKALRHLGHESTLGVPVAVASDPQLP